MIASMKIKLIVIHKTEKEFYLPLIQHFEKRINAYCDFELIEIAGLKSASTLSIEQIKIKEEALILQKLKANEQYYLLDEHGKSYTTENFSEFIRNAGIKGESSFNFIMGGAFGFSKNIMHQAKGKISLSAFTFPHQLARVVFMEQIYRCLSFIQGHPYHHQ